MILNWEAIGAVGEIIGALAVLLTLIYLAMQIRQNTSTNHANALNQILTEINQLTNHNERYIAYLIKAESGEKLSDEEAIHMVEQFLSIMRSLENFWYQYSLGNLTQKQFDDHTCLIRWTLSLPLARSLWGEIENSFNTEFRRVVIEQALSEQAPDNNLFKALDLLKQSNET